MIEDPRFLSMAGQADFTLGMLETAGAGGRVTGAWFMPKIFPLCHEFGTSLGEAVQVAVSILQSITDSTCWERCNCGPANLLNKACQLRDFGGLHSTFSSLEWLHFLGLIFMPSLLSCSASFCSNAEDRLQGLHSYHWGVLLDDVLKASGLRSWWFLSKVSLCHC